MAALAFDTLKIVQRLEEAGVPAAQARAQVAALVEVINAENEHIAETYSSKTDIAQRLTNIEADLVKIDAKLEKTAAETKAELVKWVVSVGVLQMALITALVLKLAN
ncbi:coiled-coil domain-containing protein [Chitinimonas lacunae]|uniref:Coiled-coil domain-containing protein n=1 Tax=Chitinimonas lacunae TaxID=1963018 RepID=A0ABV8MYX7_9NEIS